jgi:hypothetical protein
VWHWLNLNATAIEAATSIVSALVTAVLVFITARYVALTKQLAEAANAELLRQNEASKARRRELESQISFLRSALESLPDRDNWSHADRLIRNSTGWDTFDFAKFRARASEVSEAAASCAATVELKMRWMAELASSVKSTPLGRGYNWNSFPRDDWDHARLATREALTSILTELSK